MKKIKKLTENKDLINTFNKLKTRDSLNKKFFKKNCFIFNKFLILRKKYLLEEFFINNSFNKTIFYKKIFYRNFNKINKETKINYLFKNNLIKLTIMFIN